MLITDISGFTGDDVIALTAAGAGKYKPGGSLRYTHVMHNDWSRRERDIHDIIIRNVTAESYLCCLVRLLPVMSQIYNVVIDGIVGTSDEVKGYTAILLGEGGYGDMLPDSMRNITVSNVICNSALAVDINGYLTDSVITNVINKNPSCPAVHTSCPENLKNVVITDTVISARPK